MIFVKNSFYKFFIGCSLTLFLMGCGGTNPNDYIDTEAELDAFTEQMNHRIQKVATLLHETPIEVRNDSIAQCYCDCVSKINFGLYTEFDDFF